MIFLCPNTGGPSRRRTLPAGLAAIKPELALAFRRETMSRIPEITPANFGAHLDSFAKAHKLDAAKLHAMTTDAALAKLVEEDRQEGIARGVSKTPTVFVNGQPFVETFSVAEISKGIDTAIAEAAQ